MGWFAHVSGWFERHRFFVDASGAALFILFGTSIAYGVFGYEPGGRLGAVLWSIALIAPLAWRRTHPVASSVAVYTVALAHLLTGYPLLPTDVAVLVALYSVTVYGPRWAHLTAMASTTVGCLLFVAVVTVMAGYSSLSSYAEMLPAGIFMGVIAVAVWAFGLTRRYRRATVEALRDRADRLEVERDQQAQIATAAERARIAREMHDIVAHSLSIIVAQADGGRYAAADDPDAAVRSLGVISETGRAALTDMRRLLGVLRDDDGPVDAAPAGRGSGAVEAGPGSHPTAPAAAPGAGPGTTAHGAARVSATAGAAPRGDHVPSSSRAPLTPQPDDADLDPLVAQARDAGASVSLVRVGTARRLPPGAGLTLHRITQEALSNVRKHAGPSPRVTVVERWQPDAVVLEISDDGRGASAGAGVPGYGLVGMRERAAMFGGTLTAGPRPGGGWRVRFTMPLPPADGGPPAPVPNPQETA